MSELDKKLEEIVTEAYNVDSCCYGYDDSEVKQTVEEVKQAFIDDGWRNLGKHTSYECHVDPRFANMMTGQEWYSKFLEEIERRQDYSLGAISTLIAKEIAKKAAGIE